MRITREQALALVRKFREQLAALYGDRLTGLYLFGSHARNESDEDSDIDVAVVLAGTIDRREERHRVLAMLSDFCLRENCLLIPFFVSEGDYQAAPYAIHRSIVREGIPA